jgi:hypothetical protein
MRRAGFEPETPATERPQTYALERAANGIGLNIIPQGSKSLNFITMATVITAHT